MDQLLRWLASTRDIEVEPGTELRFELSSFPSGGLGFVVLLAIVAMLAIVILAYKRDAHRLTPGRRLILASLRAAAVLAAFALLLEPNLVAVKRDVRSGTTVILLDVSQSMTHKDPYRRTPEIAQSWRKLGVQSPATTSRIELVEQLLEKDDYRLLREFAADNDVFVYGFHSGLEPLATLDYVQPDQASDPSGDDKSIDLDGIDATGRFTNIGVAVRSALERHRDSTIAGLVVLTDGRRNLGAQGSEIARLIEQRKVAKTLVLPIGDPSATQTLRLTRIDAPEKVFQKDPFTIRANVESQGYETISVNVTLKREGQGGGVETVATQAVQLGSGMREGLVEFAKLRSAEPGIFTYTIEIDPPEFEPPSPERHVQRTQIEVLGEQTRVLMISGGPSHEFRFVRTQLIRDNTVNLSTWLLSADPDFPQDGNEVLDRLPEDRETLDAYDVFIFMDPDSTKLSEEFCNLVAKQVEENGAGLWWVCGEIYTLDALRPTASTKAITDILPVIPDVERADHRFGLGRARTQPTRFELTPEGVQHKSTRILDNKEASARLWAAMPGFYIAFPVEKPKPAAVVLAEYTDPKVRQFGRIPLIATHFYGSGRVLFTGTDDTYRWRSLYEDAHNRLWIKGIRHLFEGRLTAGNARLAINVDEEKLELGSPQHVVATIRTESFTPWVGESFGLLLEAEGSSPEPLNLTPIEGVPGQYEVRFWPTSTGFYRIRPTERLGRDVQVSFQVVPAEVEKEGPADLAELGAIASAATAQLCATPEELLTGAAEIESMSVIDTFMSSHAIWDSWVTIAALLTLLTIEWWLRKRSNLL